MQKWFNGTTKGQRWMLFGVSGFLTLIWGVGIPLLLVLGYLEMGRRGI